MADHDAAVAKRTAEIQAKYAADRAKVKETRTADRERIAKHERAKPPGAKR